MESEQNGAMPDYPWLAKARAEKKGKRKRKVEGERKRKKTTQQKRASGVQKSGERWDAAAAANKRQQLLPARAGEGRGARQKNAEVVEAEWQRCLAEVVEAEATAVAAAVVAAATAEALDGFHGRPLSNKEFNRYHRIKDAAWERKKRSRAAARASARQAAADGFAWGAASVAALAAAEAANEAYWYP